MDKIAVTGGSCGAGLYVVDELLDHGYEVLILDRTPPPKEFHCDFTKINLTHYPDVFTALQGFDAVAHFGTDHQSNTSSVDGAKQFKTNTLSTYNVFKAAATHSMAKVVWASSETVLGFPVGAVKPVSVPLDETDTPRPQTDYALSLVVCEELAARMSELYKIPIIGLRFSNFLFDNTELGETNYHDVPEYWESPFLQRMNLWSYIDVRDAAASTRLALEANIDRAENFLIAAGDTVMNWPNKKLIESVFPEIQIKQGTGSFQSLLSTEKARKMLGFTPRYSWRDFVGEVAKPGSH